MLGSGRYLVQVFDPCDHLLYTFVASADVQIRQ